MDENLYEQGSITEVVGSEYKTYFIVAIVGVLVVILAVIAATAAQNRQPSAILLPPPDITLKKWRTQKNEKKSLLKTVIEEPDNENVDNEGNEDLESNSLEVTVTDIRVEGNIF